jgi:hypothetical protein
MIPNSALFILVLIIVVLVLIEGLIQVRASEEAIKIKE